MKHLILTIVYFFALSLTGLAQDSRDLTLFETPEISLHEYKAHDGISQMAFGSVIVLTGLAGLENRKHNSNYDTKGVKTICYGVTSIGSVIIFNGISKLLKNKRKANKRRKQLLQS